MILKIYITGLLLLTGAILVNFLGSLLKFPSWYDFFADRELTPTTFIWLFIVYPFLLGILVFLINKYI